MCVCRCVHNNKLCAYIRILMHATVHVFIHVYVSVFNCVSEYMCATLCV